MFNKILYAIVIAILIFAIGGLLLPGTVHVERSVFIARPASTVFSLLNSFESFEQWSPWADRDPQTVYEYSGPESGIGSRMDWSGDPRLVGSGWQEITQSVPYSRVGMHLDFDQQGKANTYFDIVSVPDGVQLTWGFDTDLVEGQGLFGGILARYFGLFFDQWIGGDYEKGLARLKILAESLPAGNFEGLDVQILDVEPLDILFISSSVSREFGDIGESLAAAFREISEFMAKHGIEMTAQPLAITRAWDDRAYEFDAAIPVEMKQVELEGRIQSGQSPSGRAVRVVHRGPYDQMSPSYEKLAAYMAAHGLKEGRISWEHYVSDPGETLPEDLITHIYYLVDTDSERSGS